MLLESRTALSNRAYHRESYLKLSFIAIQSQT